ncbi:GNAT family N-acetyltransferase [Rhizobium sp. NZLR1b]|nr:MULTISPECIES: GNAT family N-acetyltransferase [unclassified Rhizobium]MBX5161651.1 GNAT family N-acetyltransferase [Rhizobium sp. NZLR8]MBX5173841.1 GNAT family N-acetyltransferase [Rhizobium sp. NZLR1b]
MRGGRPHVEAERRPAPAIDPIAKQAESAEKHSRQATRQMNRNPPMPELRIDPFPSPAELNALLSAAWSTPEAPDFSRILPRSLAHIGAYHDDQLIGFVNVAWDGGIHAFILDTSVHPDIRRQGIATRLVREATRVARERGAEWLHVDFQPHLTGFYRGCGFSPTEAGLIKLK